MTTEIDQATIEAVGPACTGEQLIDVRDRTLVAVHEIAEQITPGMTETEARTMAAELLRARELRKGWHKILVRFGPNSTLNFEEPSAPGVVLGDDDIFFIDVAPIYEGIEGDVGTTFVVGIDPEMARMADDVRAIWHDTRTAWLGSGLSGPALYEVAREATESRGWVLNYDLTGHRLAEFPHHAHFDGTLTDVGFAPADLRWVLEIQIRHPERAFGAFHEDLLIVDDEVQWRWPDLRGPETGCVETTRAPAVTGRTKDSQIT